MWGYCALTHIVADYQSRHVLALNHHQEVTGAGEYDAFGFRNRVGMAAAAVAKSQDVTGLGTLPVGGVDGESGCAWASSTYRTHSLATRR